jgi:Amt family ammonium transporter
LKNKLKWDDALDVWGVHGVGGLIGIVMLGIFGTVTINAAGSNGLLHGGAEFFKVQSCYFYKQHLCIRFTYGMLAN